MFLPYLLCALAAAVVLWEERKDPESGRKYHWTEILAGVFFTVVIFLGNERLFREILEAGDFPVIRKLYWGISVFLTGCGSFMTGSKIQRFLGDILERRRDGFGSARKKPLSPGMFFGLFTSAVILLDTAYLFLCAYPGNLTTDSLSQMQQIMTGVYSNHHPFWHTMVIRCFVRAGLILFHDIRVGIAFYSLFQIFLLALVFGYALSTLLEAGLSRKIVGGLALLYIFLPYHILYSVTMWKDIPFGAAALAMVTALFRFFRTMGRQRNNLVILFLGGLGFCLFRSNGWAACFFAFLIFFALSADRKAYFRMYLVLAAVLCLSAILKHPVLKMLDVTQPDPIEALALPSQQIARVIREGKVLSPEEKEILEELVPEERVKKAYDPGSADPVKAEVRMAGRQELLEKNKGDYLKLWVSLGFRYPAVYLRAWIDLTKGYWNGGYAAYIWSQGIGQNRMGIFPGRTLHGAEMVKNLYLWFFENVGLLQIIKCIGWHSWLLAGYLLLQCRRKRQEAFLAVPVLGMILTLCIAAPVFNEFRYVYGMMTVLPFLGGVLLLPDVPSRRN